MLYLRCLGCSGQNCNNMGRNNEGSNGVLDEEGLRRVPFYVHVLPDNRFERPMIHIQYWFFYPFNGPTITFGVHQGDWEHLSMLVDDTCTTRLKYRWQSHGFSSGWLDEGSDPAVEYENGHMVSYSAYNSHAGFMTEGGARGWHRHHQGLHQQRQALAPRRVGEPRGDHLPRATRQAHVERHRLCGLPRGLGHQVSLRRRPHRYPDGWRPLPWRPTLGLQPYDA